MITDDAIEFMRLYGHYKNGFLLNGGGIFQQPALYTEVMEIIDNAVNEQDED